MQHSSPTTYHATARVIPMTAEIPRDGRHYHVAPGITHYRLPDKRVLAARWLQDPTILDTLDRFLPGRRSGPIRTLARVLDTPTIDDVMTPSGPDYERASFTTDELGPYFMGLMNRALATLPPSRDPRSIPSLRTVGEGI